MVVFDHEAKGKPRDVAYSKYTTVGEDESPTLYGDLPAKALVASHEHSLGGDA